MFINGENLKFIKSWSLRVFCIFRFFFGRVGGFSVLKHKSLWFLPSEFSFPSPQADLSSEGLILASGRDSFCWNFPLMTFLFSCSPSTWWLLLETWWSASADSPLPRNTWHYDPFRVARIFLSFTAWAGYSSASANSSPGLWPVTFCGNPFQEAYSSAVSSFDASQDTHNVLGSPLYLKEIQRGWKMGGESGEGLSQSTFCLDFCRKKFLPFSGYSILIEDPWEIYLLSEFKRGAYSRLFINPQTHLGICIPHRDFAWDKSSH